MKSAVRFGLSRLIVASGMSRLGRAAFFKRGAVIFYAHRLASDRLGFLPGIRPQWFEDQVRYLSRHYRIISLSELLSHFEEGRRVPDRTAVLTFDDGFRDNLTAGLPVLKKYGAPATIFVVTGSMTTGDLPWPQRLGYLFQHTPERSVHVEDIGRFALRTFAERMSAYITVRTASLTLSRAARDARIEQLSETLKVEPPRDRMLSWADLRAMAGDGIEAGAHTYSHPWLALISSEEAREEVERCRDDLKEQLGLERPPFCFPGGSWNPELVALVRALGFRSAFRPDRKMRVNTLTNVDAFSLARTGMPKASVYELEAELEGPFHPIRKALSLAEKRGS